MKCTHAAGMTPSCAAVRDSLLLFVSRNYPPAPLTLLQLFSWIVATTAMTSIVLLLLLQVEYSSGPHCDLSLHSHSYRILDWHRACRTGGPEEEEEEEEDGGGIGKPTKLRQGASQGLAAL